MVWRAPWSYGRTQEPESMKKRVRVARFVREISLSSRNTLFKTKLCHLYSRNFFI